MKVIVDLCVVPLGVGVSVSRYVAACEPVSYTHLTLPTTPYV